MIKSLNSKYRILNSYALRTPLFSLKTILDVYNSDDTVDAIWKRFEDPCIKEAIFLASPDLFELLEKVQSKCVVDTKEKNKLTIPLLKYLTRISTRCTPFGLFAGTSVGEFVETTNIVLENRSAHLRHTRLDFEVLAQLSRRVVSAPNVLPNLLFYPNTTLYKCADQFRYIKVESFEGNKKYVLKRIEPSEFIASTISFTRRGQTFEELVNHIVALDFDNTEAKGFIEHLINAQILISSLEPYTVGQDFHEYLLSNLHDNTNFSIPSLLNICRMDMTCLDENIGNCVKLYQKNLNSFREILPSAKREHLFQVDFYPQFKINNLNHKLKIDISKTLNILSRLFEPYKNDEMKNFARAYQSRYEDQSLPLVHVLDLDYGIGYPIDKNKAVYPYINDLSLGLSNNQKSESIELNKTEIFLSGLIQNSKGENIDLSSKNINEFELKDPNLNGTFFAMAELFVKEGKTKMVLEGFAGSTASNLLGRYTNGSNDTRNLVEEIIRLEEKHHKGYIVAEIAHLPEDRTGNVLFHPNMRKYKINFLSGINKDDSCDISIEDIMIEIVDSKVVLKSKKFNKSIIPYLSNAHNYTNSNLPIYNFLCDYQFHHYSGKVGFHWGNLTKLYEYLPRITFDNVVLSKAQWIFKTDFLHSIFKKEHSDSQLIAASKNLQSDKNLPRHVQFKQGDNLLLIDFLNALSIRMFVSALPKKNIASITLLEFLHKKEGVVKDGNGMPFTNEFIFCMTNTKKDDES